jgi:hypothetical protein
VTTLPLDIGGVQVRVATQQAPGTQLTSAAGDKVREAAAAAYDSAKSMVLALATDLSATVGQLDPATRPREITLRFGVSFTTTGQAVVVSAGAASTLEFTLTYAT